MKFILSAILIIFLLFLQVFVDAASSFGTVPTDSLTNVEEGEVIVDSHHHHHKKSHHPKIHPKINCKAACARRCSKSSRKKVCTRACGTCCARCHCVPPGTYGNKNACPCYAKLTTHGHRPKCP
ncbi:Gibberellin regulated protein [Macleaya cordata]|uniref:Gibberellin regulated protein n=1 Tax=Macleaya cordata TaxID=56857 RepID=A0A200PTJ5_MACCD|nr:Gibberellin regulated protein [Macleaya cordata]